MTLDPEAWDDADAAVLSLMTEMDDRTLTFVAGLWAQRRWAQLAAAEASGRAAEVAGMAVGG